MVEVIFNFNENAAINGELNGKQYRLGKCFINGLNTCPVHLQLPMHHTFFGVQFNPVAIKSLLRVPAGEFTNQVVDLTLINTYFHTLWHQLSESNAFSHRVAIVSKWIESNAILLHPQEQLLSSFLGSLQQDAITASTLATTLCYSARHLARKIYALTQLNTEEMLLYKKYLCSLHLLHQTDLSLTEISYKSHFADQSHFIKSFKAFTQITPGVYRQTKSHLPGHIYQNVR